MKLLALVRPPEGVDVRDAVTSRAREELRALWEFYRDGLVREMYLPGGPGAVLVVEAESKLDAADRLRQLPLLAECVMELELIELEPFHVLEMLFA